MEASYSMVSEEFIKSISATDFQIEEFVRTVILDQHARDAIIDLMIDHADIMVYYHCYEILNQASRRQPELFYPYWERIASLLDHSNSYHRDFGLDLIANLAAVDEQNLFSGIAAAYYAHVNDAKFMTACCYCVRNLQRIYRYKEEQRCKILDLLLEIDRHCSFPEKQMALMKYDVMELFEQVYENTSAEYRKKISGFIQAQVESISPKTRRKAKQLMKEFEIG